MWIFTQHGYLSVVQHFDPTPGAELLIRARNRRHLAACLSRVVESGDVESMIRHTPDADYPWRAFVSRDLVRRLVVEAVDALDYSNFKGRCSRTWGADADMLHDVWSETHRLTPPSDREGR